MEISCIIDGIQFRFVRPQLSSSQQLRLLYMFDEFAAIFLFCNSTDYVRQYDVRNKLADFKDCLDIPEDMLLKISEYVNATGLATMRQVCKWWNYVCSSSSHVERSVQLWQAIKNSPYNRRPFMSFFLTKADLLENKLKISLINTKRFAVVETSNYPEVVLDHFKMLFKRVRTQHRYLDDEYGISISLFNENSVRVVTVQMKKMISMHLNPPGCQFGYDHN
jgi:hypothetical protein